MLRYGMIELHRRQSRALSLELLHDEIASSDLVDTFVSCPQILQDCVQQQMRWCAM